MDYSLRLHPPAKINLALKVLARLPNGYHALWSFMQTVGVADTLTIRVTDAFEGIRVECADDALAVPTENLVYQAADAVLRRAGKRVGVGLTLDKGIPVAAGLGGGSSDAAATIVGLNQMLGLRWTTDEMAALGHTLGGDVPFFLHAPTAVTRGWGEVVVPQTLEGVRWIVLVNPGFPIRTGEAYARLDACGRIASSVPEHLLALEHETSVSWRRILECMENDFESVLFDDYPVLAEIRETLMRAGAEGALLSGSGATVFGVFPDHTDAMRAGDMFAGMHGYRVWLAPSLRHGLSVAPPS